MGWFGGGSKEESSADTSPRDFSDGSASDFESGSSFAPSDTGGMAAGAGDIQQFSVALQQQVLIQKVIGDLTDKAFENCILGKPGENLGGKESACVSSVVNKWLDTNEFMMGRMAKKQQTQTNM